MTDNNKPSFLTPSDELHVEKPSEEMGGSSVYLEPEPFDGLINDFGVTALMEKSYFCPCRNPKSRQPNPSCKRCYGRGIAFHPPKEFRVIIQSQEKGMTNIDLGLLETGTSIGTPDRFSRLSFRDRITVPNVQISQSYIFDVTEKRVQEGFFMIYDVHEIQFATTMEKDLIEGEDYTFDFDNNIFYPKEELVGKNISLNILTTLRYIVADLLKESRNTRDRHGKTIDLNQKLLLKREDVFIEREAFALGVDNDEVNDRVDTQRKSTPNGINGFFRGGS